MPNRKTLLFTVALAAAAVLSLLAVQHVAHRPPEGGRNLLTVAKPAEVESFQVSDGTGALLWRIEAIGAASSLDRIHYGEVPSGYRQVAPASDLRPRPFASGESLQTETITSLRTFVHTGRAIGPDAFHGGVYEAGSREPVERTR